MKFILTILLIFSLSASAQTKIFGVKSGGSAYTETRRWYCNLGSDLTTSPAPSPTWNTLGFVYESWLTIGGMTFNNLETSTGVATAIDFTNTTQWTGTSNNVTTTGNNSGVFPDLVLQGMVHGLKGSKFKFTSLDNSKYYTVLVLFNTNYWEESTNAYITVGGTNSNTIANCAGNYGSSPYSMNDAALAKVEYKQPTSGELEITFNKSSSNTHVQVVAIVLIEYQ